MGKQPFSSNNSERANDFLDKFVGEHPSVRKIVLRDIQAYDMMASLHAKSFADFALIPIAREKNLPYTNPAFSLYEEIIPPCPKCNSTQYINRAGEPNYRCRACKTKFKPHHNSLSSNTNVSSTIWMKVLLCLLNHYTVARTLQIAEIHINTYYHIVERLFYAMQLMTQETKLYGEIQCDIKYERASYKGLRITANRTKQPDIGPFKPSISIGREARKRGGSYTKEELSLSQSCIFTAIDSFGHVVCRYVCIGPTTYSKLLRAVPKDRYLLEVPLKDPLPLHFKKAKQELLESEYTSGEKSLLIADKEGAIRKYATILGIRFESHVYRKNGKQLKLPKGAHDIQRVNALHRKLEGFLKGAGGAQAGTTRYLPGRLAMFEFIENTGTTTEAIGRLFEILATPGLEKPQSFFDEELYKIPNYVMEWAQDNALIRRMKNDQLTAVYLNYLRKNDPCSKLTMNDILQVTGLSSPGHVRDLYTMVESAGQLETVCKNMEDRLFSENKYVKKYQSAEYHHFLELYDAMCACLRSPIEKPQTFTSILQHLIEEMHLDMDAKVTTGHFAKIDQYVRYGELSELKEEFKRVTSQKIHEGNLELGLQFYQQVQAWRASYRRYGQAVPFTKSLYEAIAKENGLSASRVEQLVVQARKHFEQEANTKSRRSTK